MPTGFDLHSAEYFAALKRSSFLKFLPTLLKCDLRFAPPSCQKFWPRLLSMQTTIFTFLCRTVVTVIALHF